MEAAVAYPREKAPREDVIDQVDRGWLDGPFPFVEDGRLVTGEGPLLALKFVAHGGPGTKSMTTAGARPTALLALLPTWDQFAAVIEMSRKRGRRKVSRRTVGMLINSRRCAVAKKCRLL